jgi:TolB-like protein
MKFRPNGDSIWTKTYGKDYIEAIQPTRDNNFLILRNASLVKINQNGDTLWTKTYDGSYFYAIHAFEDGNFLLVGTKISEYYQHINDLVVKIKPDGTIIWSKNYSNIWTEYHSIESSGDGNFLLAGFIADNFKATSISGWLIKITPEGEIIWSKTYQKNPYANIRSIQHLRDGNFLLIGCTYHSPDVLQNDGWIVKIKPNGDIIWTRSYDKGLDDSFDAIQPTSDNNFILAGCLLKGDTASGWLVKIKPNGDTIWTKTVGKTGFNVFRTIQSTNDGNFLVAGAGNTSILCIISDQYAYKNSKFTYKIPTYSNDTLNFGYASLKVPSGMTVSDGGTVSWTPNTDSVYLEHAEFLVFNDSGRKDTLTFNIFVNSDYKIQNVSRPLTPNKTAISPFDITITSSPGSVKFNLQSSAGILSIYDIKGRIIDKISPAESSSRTCISWPGDRPNRSTIHAGNYIVKVSCGNVLTAKMFVLMK